MSLKNLSIVLRARLLLLGLLLSCLSSAAQSATHEQVMLSKYLRTQFCIERAMGQRWHERYGVRLVVNRWGVSEPIASGLAQAPKALRDADSRCRRENEIADELRP